MLGTSVRLVTQVLLLLTFVGTFQVGFPWKRILERPCSAQLVSNSKCILNYAESVKEYSVSVCIPAIPRDVTSGCLAELIYSIKSQTVSAAEVIIPFTNLTYPEAQRMRTLVQETITRVPFQVIRATETYVQGKSRNNAVLVSTAELISFIDADDTMHPQRLEVIKEVFRKNRELQVFFMDTQETKIRTLTI